MSNCISGLISNILRDYVNPLEGDQVSISIWNGNAEIRDLSLKPTALIKAGTPLNVINGTIGKFRLHYPWGIRDVQPTSIKITDINIEAEFIEDIKFKRIQNRVKESEKEHKSSKEDNQPHNTSFLGRFFSSISDNVNKKIVSNLIVEINQFNFIVHMNTENLHQDAIITMQFSNLRLNMQNENSYFAVDRILFSINTHNSNNLDSKPKMQFSMRGFTADTNKTTSDIILNQPTFVLDINAFVVPDVFVTVFNSSWHQSKGQNNKQTEKNDSEKNSQNTFLTKYTISGMKADIYDKNIDFNVDIDGKFHSCGLKKNLEVNKFDVYISEDNHKYPFIFHDMIIKIEKNDKDVYFDLNHFNPSLSYSDMIDLSNFYNKREKLESFFNEKKKNEDEDEETEEQNNDDDNDKKKHHHHHKKHHHKKHHNKKNKNNDDDFETEEIYYNDSDNLENNQSSDQNTNEKQTWHYKPFEFLILIYENNRTTNIPYPFFRIKSNVPELTVFFDKESKIPIPDFECDIFNKKTQKWDVIMEPISIMVYMKNKNSYRSIFEKPINLICSLQSLIQINQFSYKRLKYDSNDKYPHYLIENNTNDAFTIKCRHSLTIDPYQAKDFVYKEPFLIKSIKIDPINFFSPTFINNNIAVSIFSKEKKKVISINYCIQIKNKSLMKLFYQNSKNNVTEIRSNGVTALQHFSPKFLINGTEEINNSEMIQFDNIKNQKKILIDVFIKNVTYKMFLSYKFSKKKGIFMLIIQPRFKIVNELHIPIKFIVPEQNASLELKEQSTGFINDIDQNDNFKCIIEMNDNKSDEVTFDVKNENTIPVKFQNNQLLSIFYNDYTLLIKPPMTIKNQTPFPISVYDSNGQIAIQTKANDDIPFGSIDYFDSDEIKIAFQISEYTKTDLFKLRDGRKEFLLKSEKNPNIFYPIVMANYLGANGVFHLIFDSLIKIKNKTKKQINIFPVDQSNQKCDDSIISIKPNESCPITKVSKSFNFSVSFQNSTKIHIVSFKFNNSENKLIEENNSKIEIQTRVKFANISYYVIFNELDDKEEIKKQSDNKQAETFALDIQIPRFAIIVLDEKMREMFNFAFNKISYKYEPSNEKEVFNGTIDDFEIDDMIPSTGMKKVLYTAAHPFVFVRIHNDDNNNENENNTNICDVQINPVVFNFDFNFVSNVLTDMMKLYRDEPEEDHKTEEEEDDEKDEEEQNDAFDPAYYSLHNSNEKIDYYVAPENGYYICVQQLNIKPFLFGMNFTQNLRPTVQDFEFGSIPYLNDSVYNFVFKFNQFSMSNLNATIDELMNIFVESYNAGFMLSFFDSLPLNPKNILKRFNYLKSKGGMATIDFNNIQYNDIFNSFNNNLKFKIGKKEDIGNQNIDWMRYPRSLNYGNQIVPFDEDASICQLMFQKEIKCFDEYFTLFIKNDKNIYGISQFYFVEFHKKNHFKLEKIKQFKDINSVDINKKVLTLAFNDSSNEKINCENEEIANKAYKVIFNRLHTHIYGHSLDE